MLAEKQFSLPPGPLTPTLHPTPIYNFIEDVCATDKSKQVGCCCLPPVMWNVCVMVRVWVVALTLAMVHARLVLFSRVLMQVQTFVREFLLQTFVHFPLPPWKNLFRLNSYCLLKVSQTNKKKWKYKRTNLQMDSGLMWRGTPGIVGWSIHRSELKKRRLFLSCLINLHKH
jgi:hypothetical protein